MESTENAEAANYARISLKQLTDDILQQSTTSKTHNHHHHIQQKVWSSYRRANHRQHHVSFYGNNGQQKPINPHKYMPKVKTKHNLITLILRNAR